MPGLIAGSAAYFHPVPDLPGAYGCCVHFAWQKCWRGNAEKCQQSWQ
jgi:hypothetical protein